MLAAGPECPILSGQHRVLLNTEKANVFFDSITFDCPGTESPSLAKLQQAFEVLSRRHDAIRCRFEEDSRGDWHQYVDPPRSDVSRSVAVHELHALAPDARDEAIKSILQEMARGARLEEGNLVRFNLFRTPGTALLNILSHHIVTDYFSLMLLKRELSQLMSGPEVDSARLLPPTTPFSVWAETLDRWGRSGRFDDRIPSWSEELETAGDPIAFGGDEEELRFCSFSLDAEETRPFLSAVTHSDALVAAAVARGLARWSNARAAVFHWMVQGRELAEGGIDLRRTVGSVARHVPIVLEVTPGSSVADLAGAAEGFLRNGSGRSLEFAGLAYHGRDEAFGQRLRRHPAMPIRVQMFRQSSPTPGWRPSSAGKELVTRFIEASGTNLALIIRVGISDGKLSAGISGLRCPIGRAIEDLAAALHSELLGVAAG